MSQINIFKPFTMPKDLNPSRLPVPSPFIERWIYIIRGQKVMLSPDLAELYQVEPRALVQAVKRNLEPLPRRFYVSVDQRGVCKRSQNMA